MSIFSKLGTKVTLGALGLVGIAGGVTTLAATNPAIQNNFKAVETAIVSKDLGAYKTALIQKATDRGNSTTQEQLNTMADRQLKQKAVFEAIKNNDYNAFKTSADARALSHTPDQASFDKLVKMAKDKVDELTKLDVAVIANDSSAYIKAVKEHEANKPMDMNDKMNKDHSDKIPKDAKIQTRFDKDRANYVADSTILPSTHINNKGNFGGGMDGKSRGHRGQGGDSSGTRDGINDMNK